MGQGPTQQQAGFITKEEVGAFYDRLAPELSALRRKNAYYHELLEGLLRVLIPRGRRVLDVGCGQGDVLNMLQPCYGVGIDLSSGMIARARNKYPHLYFSVGDAERLDFKREPFDYILLSNTVGYLQDIQKAIHCLKPYSSPQTRVVITHYNYLWEPVLKLAEKLGLKMREPYQNWLSVEDTENLLALEDFEVVRRCRAVLLPKRVPILSSLVNRHLPQLPLFQALSLVWAVVARPVPQREKRECYSCTIVVPARNERGTIEALVKRIPDMGTHTELVFVEGHSRDGTREEIARVMAANPGRDIKLLTQDGEGKGDAVRKGFEHSRGDILIVLDADMSVDPEELPKFYQAVASGNAELAIGCRLVYQMERQSMRTLNLLGNKFFSLIFTWILGQRIKDTLCGTKALFRGDYENIKRNRGFFGDLDPFGDFDLIFGAAKQNLKIVELPVRYRARTYGATNIKRFKHGLMLLKMACIGMRKFKLL